MRKEGNSPHSPRQSQTVSKVLWESERLRARNVIHVATPVQLYDGQKLASEAAGYAKPKILLANVTTLWADG